MKGFQPRTPLLCDLRLCQLFLPRNSPFCDAMRALYNGEPRVQRPFKSHSSAAITGIQCYMTTQLAHNSQAGARPSRHHLQPARRDDNADDLSRRISSQSRVLYNNSPSAMVIRVTNEFSSDCSRSTHTQFSFLQFIFLRYDNIHITKQLCINVAT